MSDAVEAPRRKSMQFGLRTLLVVMTVAAVVMFVFAREPQFIPTIGNAVLLGMLLYFAVSTIAEPNGPHRVFRLGFITGAMGWLYFSKTVLDSSFGYLSWYHPFLEELVLANLPAVIVIGLAWGIGWLTGVLARRAEAIEAFVAKSQQRFLAWLRQGSEAWHARVRLAAAASIALLGVLIPAQLAAVYLPRLTATLSNLTLGLTALIAVMLAIVLRNPARRLFVAYAVAAFLNTWLIFGGPLYSSRHTPVVVLLQYFHRGLARTVDEYGKWENSFLFAGIPMVSMWLGVMAMIYVATRSEQPEEECPSQAR